MENFHLEGLVHGDLRDANILCKEEYVMLLDFDCGGKDGEVFDRRVLGKTLAKLYV